MQQPIQKIRRQELPYSIAEMVALLDRAFPEDEITIKPALGIGDNMMAPNAAALLAKPSTIIGTASKDGQLVAISVAIPKSEFDPHNPDPETVYVYYAAVEPALQGNGLIAAAARSLESQLKDLSYVFIEQDCVKENGYADTISRAYADTIVNQYDHVKYPEIGPQRFFRIDLNRLPLQDLTMSLQPTLRGELLKLRPLQNDDYSALFEAASDPLIWEMHPQPDRYKPDVFKSFFADAIASKGALVVIDLKNSKIVGTSR